jgi:hypothetical protein
VTRSLSSIRGPLRSSRFLRPDPEFVTQHASGASLWPRDGRRKPDRGCGPAFLTGFTLPALVNKQFPYVPPRFS